MGRRIAFHEERCTNCHLCAMFCSLAFSEGGRVLFRPTIARIRVIEDEEASRYVAHVCLQCADPACLEVCPTGALSRDEERGCVVLDEGACTGCGLCVEACPFGGIFLVDGKAVKCEVCDAPLCVRACAAKALECVAWDAGEVEKQGRLYREVPL